MPAIKSLNSRQCGDSRAAVLAPRLPVSANTIIGAPWLKAAFACLQVASLQTMTVGHEHNLER